MPFHRTNPHFLVAMLAAAIGAIACSEDRNPAGPEPRLEAGKAAPAPASLVSASYDGATITLWPYTTDDFQSPSDPVNLLFIGNSDPRTIRAALLSVDENRVGFPLPLACRWQDVPEGGIQATYAEGTGWAGSAIQLSCGDYSTLRFHLRLFATGAWTIGAAHVEFLIPGTTEHQVLSWELAEQFVAYDLARSGMGGPVGAAAINDAPVFRTIPAQIVGALVSDPALAPLLGIACPAGVPWDCDGSADVGILTDGTATIVAMTGDPTAETGSFRRTATIEFDQVIPKPFCIDAAMPYVLVQGPIEFREHWVLTPSNNYIAHFEARGTLSLTPINPETGETGSTYLATVREEHRAMITDHQNRAAQIQMQIELPPDTPFHGMLSIDFSVGPNGLTGYSVSLSCGGI